MAHTVVLRDVPEDQVETVVSDYQAEGATVSVTQQPDGNFTITATLPDSDAAGRVASLHGVVDHALLSWQAT